VPQQHTLKNTATFTGIGLHGGNKVSLVLHPAPAGHGVRFRRLDLEGKPEIEARAELVSDTQRSTTLAKGSVKVHTVEHVLAALVGALARLAMVKDGAVVGAALGHSDLFGNARTKPSGGVEDPGNCYFTLSNLLFLKISD
jgi:hypothetical protein